MGETIKARAMRGGSVQVTLKAFEGRGNPLTYEIITPPRHGNLQDFQQADEDRQGFASVVYVHGDDEESQEDEFTFKARALIGGGVSSPIKVSVRIIDEAPQLQIVRALDFSAAAGERESKQIELANIGGGLLEGHIAPKEPFYVEGEGRFNLGRGKTTNVAVRFAPQSTDSVAPQTLTPARANPGAKITLRGIASAPFSADAGNMEVFTDGSRMGSVTIKNLSTSILDVTIDIQPPGAAQAPQTARVATHQTAAIPIRIGVDKKGGEMEIRVCVRNRHYAQELPVRVPAVPADPDLVSPFLDFRESAEATLSVTNRGGEEALFSLELPGNIKSNEKSINLSVAPGQVRAVSLHFSDIGRLCSKTAFVDFKQEAKVPVAVLWPAKLEVLTEALDFRNNQEATVELKNSGDVAGKVTLKLPQGVRALNEAKTLTVAAGSQTNVRLVRELDEDIPPNARVTVDLGRDGKALLQILAPSAKVQKSPNFPWQLNKEVKVEDFANGRLKVSWLRTKSTWTDAQLEVVREGKVMTYQPSTEKSRWWDTIKAWWTTKRQAAQKALDAKRDFFMDRLTPLPGEEEENETFDTQAQPSSKQAEIVAEDYQNIALFWRVSARNKASREREQVSEDFYCDQEGKRLMPMQTSLRAPKNQMAFSPIQQPIRVINHQMRADETVITVAVAYPDGDPQLRVEQIVGALSPNEGETGGVRYATVPLPQSAASVDNKTGMLRSENVTLRTVTLRFKNLERGTAMLCRLVSDQNPHKWSPTTPFLVEGPPARIFPWKWLLAGLAGVLLCLLGWPRLRTALS